MLRTVSDVLDRREVIAHSLDLGRVTTGDPTGATEPEREYPKQYLSSSAADVRSATPYLWLEELRVVAANARLPRHVVSRDVLPEPLMLWLYPQPRPHVRRQGDRAERRRRAKAGLDPTAKVTFVELRRSAIQDQENHHAVEEIGWSHRWWVIGHPRAQWYPSLGAHRLVWIAPHVKGPEGKPLWPQAFRVSR